ncbi:MAG: TRAP transporter substrate-binding protein DctP [Planctomycetes bacterium]|nr:TRAP transporter substrate-binding protein DctP [Planctomycetota bacterium]
MRVYQTVVAATMTLVFFAGSVASWAAEPVLRFQMAAADNGDGTAAAMAETIAGQVERATDGDIHLDVVVTTEPRGAVQVYEDLMSGTAGLALVDARVLAVRNPGLQILGQPFSFPDRQAAIAFFHGAGGERVTALAGRTGCRVLGWIQSPPPVFLAAKPLTRAADFQGLRLAGDPNLMSSEVFAALGTTVVQVPGDQLAAALEAKRVDAVEISPRAILSSDFPEEFRTITMAYHSFPAVAVCCSNAVWGRLDEEGRARLTAIVDNAAKMITHQQYAQANAASIALKNEGFTTVTADRVDLVSIASPVTERAAAVSDRELADVVTESRNPRTIF